nr:Rne/Rng family ribonuclease [Corynebacterium sp. 76QC2CO]
MRHRVEKNVENEISQIEQKVERELAQRTESTESTERAEGAGAVETSAVEVVASSERIASEEEQLRYRVEKNVENEIHQIEEKVERELAERAGGQEAAGEPFALAVEEELNAEPLEDVTPEITPAPVAEQVAQPVFATPLFVAPDLEAIAEDWEGEDTDGAEEAEDAEPAEDTEDTDDTEEKATRGRRRGKRGTGRGRGRGRDRSDSDVTFDEDDAEDEDSLISEPKAIRGSTRLEAQRRRRAEMREEQRKKRHIVSEAEFLARRESVTRTMVVRERERLDAPGSVTQVGVLEDDMLVEHFVTSDTQASMVGNIYLGRVQNVLPSMEAAFIDIGKGRNGVLYAGEVDWRAKGLGGRNRKIEQALKPGDAVLVQVSKDPIGHKGARLTTQISLAGRYLVYVPGGRTAGISRKLPAPERNRLKSILKEVVPQDGGVIIRTAAEGVPAEAIAADVQRLHTQWEQIQERTNEQKEAKSAKPQTLYEEPNMLVKVVRDIFNEDFTTLVIDGRRAWNTVHAYVSSVAPELVDRLVRYDRDEHDGVDAFEEYRVEEQLKKALSRKVWLPSGGTLVIDRTEAMTVIDVNTGKFTGAGGNLEETVTRNNLEAAEEIVRQMRLRDLGGMIVVDFIDMVLPENQDLVLRRLTEALGRDRTRHQISEVTSLGLVQMTRKRLGTGLLETFATECEHCQGRGVIIHDDPVEHRDPEAKVREHKRRPAPAHDPAQHPAAVAMHEHQQHQQTSKRTSDEELAEAVLGSELFTDEEPQDMEERQVEATQATQPESDESESGVRRSRRRRSRRSTREQTPQAADVLDIVDAALERAEEEEPDEPSGRDHLPVGAADKNLQPTTYEEAKAAFDASPRRRRKVRGNSVSDVEPKPEDFQKPASEPAPETAAEPVEAEREPAAGKGRRRRRVSTAAKKPKVEVGSELEAQDSTDDKPAASQSAPASSGRERGRRRAVRKTSRSSQGSSLKQGTADSTAATSATSATDDGAAPADRKAKEATAPRATGSARGSRAAGGRRRAVRRS